MTLKKSLNLHLSEDIGQGDVSSVLIDNKIIEAEIICRDDAIICGVEFFNLCFLSIDPKIQIHWKVEDGSRVKSGDKICGLKGNTKTIVTAERAALNFLQILSATATQTSYLVSLIKVRMQNCLIQEKQYLALERRKNMRLSVVVG